MTKRLTNLVLSLALLSTYSVAQETEETTGTVYGVVTADADGGRVVIPGIKVALNGPTHIEVLNQITTTWRDPRSEEWNLELDRQITSNLLVHASYQQRNTVHEFVLTPTASGEAGVLSLRNSGRQFYREVQVTGRYRLGCGTLNASYTRSRAYGDLNDFNQFFGNDPQVVIQPNQLARLPFDAPNRYLVWGEFRAPWKLTVAPVCDLHTGFPYSVINQSREFVGPRNDMRFLRFASSLR